MEICHMVLDAVGVEKEGAPCRGVEQLRQLVVKVLGLGA